jgi:hypothetical protein
MARRKGGREAKQALRRFRKFWGLKRPTKVLRVPPLGVKKRGVLVSMGISPQVVLANGPRKGRGVKIRRIRQKMYAATDSTGKKIFLLKKGKSKLGRAPRGKLKFLGWVPETHYVPTKDLERAGTFKKGAYWTHKHDDKGGRWPKAFVDDRGNLIYKGGTFRVTDWIHR